MDVKTIKKHIGAEVHIDRAEFADESMARTCLELLEQHTVLVFPQIGLSNAEQLAFTDRLGARVNFTTTAGGGDVEMQDVYTITLDRKINATPEYVYGTYFWHMDGVTSDIPPPKATLLSARNLAPKGGQTEFCSTYAAYEALPVQEKADIEGLRVMHTLLASMRPLIQMPTAEEFERWSTSHFREHPLVWTHQSGRKSLVVGTHADHVVGMSLPEGRALLWRLLEWTGQPDFTYRHPWQEGDLVIWDNPGALHRVMPYSEESGRKMHRTTVAGVETIN